MGSSSRRRVGGLKHELGDEDAGALAAAEALNGLVELLASEKETRGPAGDVDEAAVVDDRVAFGREGAAQGEGGVDFAKLGEVDGAEHGGAFDGAARRFELAGEQAEEGGFAAAVGTDEAEADAVGEQEVEIAEDRAVAEVAADVLELNEALGLAVGGGKVDACGGFNGALVGVGECTDHFVCAVDAGFGLGGAGLGTSAEPPRFRS